VIQVGLSFTIVSVDEPDAFHVEVRAWNHGYTGTTRIWMTPAELAEVASTLAGFPATFPDVRSVAMGHRDGDTYRGLRWARGFCSLDFRLGPGDSTAMIDAYFEDEDSQATASFRLPTEAALVDRLVSSLRRLSTTEMKSAIGQGAVLAESA
jgi:hypothetical protein